MDHRRFDSFARRLATARDRRRFLSAAVAAVVTSIGVPRGALAQDACPSGCPEGQVCASGACVTGCQNHRDCRSKHDDPCVLNMCVDGLCVSAIVDCLPGHECCEGECCPSGCASDVDCTIHDPCRWGRCGADGQCEFVDLDPCVICAFDEECVSNGENTVCCEGSCRRPCPEGTVMGKGCECRAGSSPTLDGVVVRDDASGVSDDRVAN